jgi:hypothetical protein
MEEAVSDRAPEAEWDGAEVSDPVSERAVELALDQAQVSDSDWEWALASGWAQEADPARAAAPHPV